MLIIFALMAFNAVSIGVTIITISLLSKTSHPKMLGWLYRLVSKSRKINVQENPNVNRISQNIQHIEDLDSESSPDDVKTAPSDLEQEQRDEKWKEFANSMNNFLFLLFSVGLVILLATIFGLWISGSKRDKHV